MSITVFIITIIVIAAYWKFTDQKVMKELKAEQKAFQARMKELREHPEQMMKVQKEAMAKNMEYFKHSLKPTLITMLPILLIFGWMSGAIAYEPIFPDESFVVSADFAKGISGDATLILPVGMSFANSEAAVEIVDSEASWRLRAAEEGEYAITVSLTEGVSESKDILISTDLEYAEPFDVFANSDIEKITIEYEKLRPFGSFSIFSWQPGWLAVYILFSIVFSLSLRKLFGLH